MSSLPDFFTLRFYQHRYTAIPTASIRHAGMALIICSLTTLTACSSSGGNSSAEDENSGDPNNGEMNEGNTEGNENNGEDTNPQEQCGVAGALEYDESVEGDLSNDRLLPTVLQFGPGANVLNAVTGSPDVVDYATFNIAPCDTLDSVTLVSYSGQDDVAAFTMQAGNTFTLEPFAAQNNLDQILGYTHFGTLYLGNDLLDLAHTAAGAIGFTTPLGSGEYTLWLQQAGQPASYSLSFNVSRVITP